MVSLYATITIHITFSVVAVWLPFIGHFSLWLFPVVIEFTSQDMAWPSLLSYSLPVAALFCHCLPWQH